jgi:hypothetical protein
MGTGMVKLDNQIKPNKMTATLTFDLKEDQHAFDCVVNATKMHDVLVEIRHRLKVMPEITSYSKDEIKMAVFIYELLLNEIEDAGINHLL